jgi:hypothetical protein
MRRRRLLCRTLPVPHQGLTCTAPWGRPHPCASQPSGSPCSSTTRSGVPSRTRSTPLRSLACCPQCVGAPQRVHDGHREQHTSGVIPICRCRLAGTSACSHCRAVARKKSMRQFSASAFPASARLSARGNVGEDHEHTMTRTNSSALSRIYSPACLLDPRIAANTGPNSAPCCTPDMSSSAWPSTPASRQKTWHGWATRSVMHMSHRNN